MAKNQNTKSTLKPAKTVKPVYEIIEKYFWFVIPVFTLIYYISSKYSLGFYQDDEIAQYLNMIEFWTNPSVILGNNPKPGWKIFTVIPALISYDAVLIFNSFIASLTVYFTYRLIKLYEIPYAFFGALLLGIQPLFFDLSFRSYSEIFTALLIVFFLILYKKEQYIFSSVILGYIYTVRQEIAVFIVIFAVILIINKKFIPVLFLAVFPVLYNLLGFFKTGDILFILTEMKSVAGLNYASQGIFHYFKFYIFIIGPVSLLMFIFGFLGFLADTKNTKEYFSKYLLFYLLFLSIFVIQTMTMINDGPNPGNWRYLLHISPIAAFFATVGLNNLSKESFRKTSFILGGILMVLTLAFLSNASDGFKFKEPAQSDYTKVLFILLTFAAAIIFPIKNKTDYLNKISLLIIIACIIYLAVDFKPKVLSPENVAVKTTAEYLNKLGKQDINIYTNHSLLKFYSDNYRKNPNGFLSINSKNLSGMKPGSIVAWESHYGYRPEFTSDVKLETLQADSSFKMINQIVSSDRRFAAFIFEKMK